MTAPVVPEIHTWRSDNAAPEFRWFARFVENGKPAPYFFFGPDEEDVVRQAQGRFISDSMKVARAIARDAIGYGKKDGE